MVPMTWKCPKPWVPVGSHIRGVGFLASPVVEAEASHEIRRGVIDNLEAIEAVLRLVASCRTKGATCWTQRSLIEQSRIMSLGLFGKWWDCDMCMYIIIYIHMYRVNFYIFISLCIQHWIIWYMWVVTVAIPTDPDKNSTCPLQRQVVTSIVIAFANPVWVTTQFPANESQPIFIQQLDGWGNPCN